MKKILVLTLLLLMSIVPICDAKRILTCDDEMLIEFPDSYFIATKTGIVHKGFAKDKLDNQFFQALQEDVFRI